MPHAILVLALAAGILTGAAALAQGPSPSPKGGYGNWLPGSGGKNNKDTDPNHRSVTGTVKTADDSLVDGAVVQIRNTKTSEVRKIITKSDGVYSFQGLSSTVDYELTAQCKGMASLPRTLSTFDERKRAIIHLKLESNKK
jgi:hypothetical protein